MVRFSANLGFLWSQLPLLERIERAAKNGFKAIELQWPYDTPAQDVRAAVKRLNLTLLAVNTPVGDASIGESGLGALPGREADFKKAFDQSVQWCVGSGAPAIHVMPGLASAQMEPEARKTFIANLQWAADVAAPHGITLLLEAINQRDKPGYFYSRQADSNAIREACGRSNIKLMFDVYHVGCAEGDILTKLAQYMPHIGHIQIAAVPTRNEPDEGEVNYPNVLKRVDELGYTGWNGSEYRPRGEVEAGLGWLKAY
ncbi:MAG: TIM barrel protein [Burkholderiales bacterium]|nr:TIM barrel protein [Burkholderiales bacterium]